MGVKASKSFNSSSSLAVSSVSDAKNDNDEIKTIATNNGPKIQTVEFDVAGRRYDQYEGLLTQFLDGFFLNEDLECASIRTCYASFWNIFKMTDAASKGAKYRIFKKTFPKPDGKGKDTGWGVVKLYSDQTLVQLGIVKSEMQISIDYEALNSRKSSFEKLVTAFFEDKDFELLVLKDVNTTDFASIKAILIEIAKNHPDVAFKTKTVIENEKSGQQFDYIVSKQGRQLVVSSSSDAQIMPPKEEFVKHKCDADYI